MRKIWGDIYTPNISYNFVLHKRPINLVLRIYGNCLIRDSIRYILNNDIINTLGILIWIVTVITVPINF